MRRWLLLMFVLACAPAWAAHGYALWGELRYPPGFGHFEYVRSDAPKGGTLSLVSNLRYSTFDKYNPFTMKGSPPAYLSELLFDSLLEGALDEQGAAYGLLADDVQVAADRLSATFHIRPEARFHNGDPVLARDVQHSFDTLVGPEVSPGWRTILAQVAGVDIVDPHTVRFRFRRPDRELPLTVGGLPVFSHKWGQGKPFSEVVTEPPIGSGPYRIGPVKFGRDITYVRDPQYWARDLNVRRGAFNFDRVTVKIYRDATARLEALKAGEFDMMTFYSAGDWARRVTGRKFDSGELVKAELRHRLPAGFQSFVLNSRRSRLSDRRVREALGLAMDFEWMDRTMFYGSYQRVHGLFGNTPCEARGRPDAAQRELLEPWRDALPPEVFGEDFVAPRTDRPHDARVGGLRENLRRARKLLAEAGWTVRDGALRDADGRAMVLQYLDSNEGGARVVAPWQRNLRKLGIELRYRSVDFALYQQRLQRFNFDITTIAYRGTAHPGQEYADIFGSVAADTEDSGNLAGVRMPAVDHLIDTMVSAGSEDEYLAACRALDRVIGHEHYLIPQWFSPVHRVAYNAWHLRRPEHMPPFAQPDAWALLTWWHTPD